MGFFAALCRFLKCDRTVYPNLKRFGVLHLKVLIKVSYDDYTLHNALSISSTKELKTVSSESNGADTSSVLSDISFRCIFPKAISLLSISFSRRLASLLKPNVKNKFYLKKGNK